MDSYFLTCGGTTVNLGSWVQADPGPDFGERDLLRAVYSENPRREGGRLSHEQVGVRRMVFPLILASGGASQTLTGLEGLLRVLARPGAVLDLKPAGAATGDMVRFDVLTGRWEPDYKIRHHEISRRLGMLELDVQPFGYLPTWITLASVASVGLPGRLEIPNASIIGDVPGYARLVIEPALNAITTVIGSWAPDALAWSLAARPSFTSLLPGGSWIGALPSSSYRARAEAVNATVLQWMLASNHVGWTQIAYYDIPAALEPAYRGRFRAYAYLRQHPALYADRNTMRVSLDAQTMAPSAALASIHAVATLVEQPASAWSPQLLDLGEISLPPVGSGATRDVRLRLWAAKATHAGNSNAFGDLHGVCLLPLDGPNGILSRGLALPDFRPPVGSPGRLILDGRDELAQAGLASGPLASTVPVIDALQWYRGGYPLVGGSTLDLTVIPAARRGESATGYVGEVLRDGPHVYYRMEDASGTIVDSSGNALHTSFPGGLTGSQPGAFDAAAPNLAGVFVSGRITAASHGNNAIANTDFAVEAWLRRDELAPATHQVVLAAGAVDGAWTRLYCGIRAPGDATWPNRLYMEFGGGTGLIVGPKLEDRDWHHVVWQYNRDARAQMIYMDASLVASALVATHMSGSVVQFTVGAAGAGNRQYEGGLDEFAYYRSKYLSEDRVRAHYLAGRGNDRLLARPAAARAAVSVAYQPRFAFLKGGI